MAKTITKLWSNVECDAWIFSEKIMASLTKAKAIKFKILHQEYGKIFKKIKRLERSINFSVSDSRRWGKIQKFKVLANKLGEIVERVQRLQEK